MNLAEKYRPKTLKEIIGQPKAVKAVENFIVNFRPGRGLLLCGPPGSGKNALIEALVCERGMEMVVVTASDERGAEEIEKLFSAALTKSLASKGKIIVIDDVDAVSSKDRGCVQAIVRLIKKSAYPVFLTAANPWEQKLLPLRQHCDIVKLNRIPYTSVEKRLREIAEKEGINADEYSIKQIAVSSSGDLRAALNDLEVLRSGKYVGFREREKTIFEILPLIFNSGNMKVTRTAMFSADKDPDEVFWWVENNLPEVFKSPEELAKAFDFLSKADILRGNVAAQQNWRLRMYMSDIISGLSVLKSGRAGYVQYQPPKRFVQLGSLRSRRALMDGLCKKIGEMTHSSVRTVKREYIPLLKIMLKNKTKIPFLEKEEEKLIKSL